MHIVAFDFTLHLTKIQCHHNNTIVLQVVNRYYVGVLPKSREHSTIRIYLGFCRVMNRSGIEHCTVISRSDPTYSFDLYLTVMNFGVLYSTH